MPFGLIYEIQFTNVEHQKVVVQICDNETFAPDATPAYVQLEGSGQPFTLQVIDNSEDKFTPIRAKRATLEFISNDSYNITTFSNGADNRWYVQTYINDEANVIFRGHLVLDDLEQPFLPSAASSTVTLTATDGLGTLKDTPLTNTIEKNPRGHWNIITYLYWCLRKTNLDLKIAVAFNIVEQSASSTVPFIHQHTNAKTFEDRINVSINCYDALRQILESFNCFITQRRGNWWIQHIDEMGADPQYVTVFNQNLTYTQQEGKYYNKVIGENEDIWFAQENTLVKIERPRKEAVVEYPYNLPAEIIDNIDFSRGDLQSSSGEYKYYDLDDWTVFKSLKHSEQDFWTQSLAPNYGARIVRKFNDLDVEVERYVQLDAENTNYHYLKSNPIPLGLKDRFTFSIDMRLEQNIPRAQPYDMEVMLVLFGTDGNQYVYAIHHLVDNLTNRNDAEWRTLTYEVTPDSVPVVYPGITSGQEGGMPVGGDLVVYIPFHQRGANNSIFKVNVANLRFDYNPYINGSYQKYSGQHSRVYRDGNDFKAVEKKTVLLNDSPRPLFKGSLRKPNQFGNWVSTEKWYNAQQYRTRPTDDKFFPLGRTNAFSVWNQVRNANSVFQATLKGLQTNGEVPDIIHKFFIQDNHQLSNNRYFLCVGYDQDFYTCEWTATFIEVYNTITGKDYDDNYEFKYLDGR